nr:Toll/interleukin-1 receptor (TIR) domain-containing protein [Tanacetum cinerariifolium]
MDTRVNEVTSYLEPHVGDVRMIGIWGMGGSGKTTLARAVFDQISIQFEERYLKEQLEALAGDHNWFQPGSRIIITTRDEQVLVAHRVSLINNVSLLSEAEAGCLFSSYAFGREGPIEGYEELSGKVIQYAHGLPLTIKVLGSFLCGQIGLRVLEQRSLITYNKYGVLWMHDHLEELGRNIDRRDEPQRHSRLWDRKEIEHILTNKLGTQETQCLFFWSPDFSAEIAIKGLAKMNNLKVLDIWVLTNLRFLSIKWSKLRTFDLRLAPNLESLIIYECKDFVELQMPAESLKLETSSTSS